MNMEIRFGQGLDERSSDSGFAHENPLANV